MKSNIPVDWHKSHSSTPWPWPSFSNSKCCNFSCLVNVLLTLREIEQTLLLPSNRNSCILPSHGATANVHRDLDLNFQRQILFMNISIYQRISQMANRWSQTSNGFSIRCAGDNTILSFNPQILLPFPHFLGGVENMYSQFLVNWVFWDFCGLWWIMVKVLEIYKK